MAEYEGRTTILDDGTRVPAYNNGVPYPAHVAAEDLSDGSTREHSPRGDGALDDPEDFPNCYDTHHDLMNDVFPRSVDEQDEDNNDSHLADDSELDEEDEAYDPDGNQYIDDYGYVRNKDSAMDHSGYDRILLALQRVGVPFKRTNSITISPDGTLELSIVNPDGPDTSTKDDEDWGVEEDWM